MEACGNSRWLSVPCSTIYRLLLYYILLNWAFLAENTSRDAIYISSDDVWSGEVFATLLPYRPELTQYNTAIPTNARHTGAPALGIRREEPWSFAVLSFWHLFHSLMRDKIGYTENKRPEIAIRHPLAGHWFIPFAWVSLRAFLHARCCCRCYYRHLVAGALCRCL